MYGKCPKCDALVMTVDLNAVEARGGGRAWNVVTYHCQSCHAVLSVAPDPVALGADMTQMMARRVAALLNRG